MTMTDTDMLAELYYQHVDPAYQDDEEADEAETLNYIAHAIDDMIADLDADQIKICQDNIDEITQYIEEALNG